MAKRGNPNIGNEAKKAGTCFGGKNGNKPNGGGFLGGGKTFRQWNSELMFMTAEELKAFSEDQTKPAVVRRAAVILANLSDVKELSTAADIIESKPVQVIDNRISELPPILQPIKMEIDEADDCGDENTEA